MDKGYLIDATARTITPLDYNSRVLRRIMPGGITVAWQFDTRDVLYVDDEGLLRPAVPGFRIAERPDGQPMMGNGVLTGPDDVNEVTLPPIMSIQRLAYSIEWLTIGQSLAWFRKMAHKPAITVSSPGNPPEVIAHWADILRNLEGGEGYSPKG